MKERVAALVADGFQDSEYFLPKIALEDQLGLSVEVISTTRGPVEIYSYFSRIGLLDVTVTIQEADPRDYIGVLVPGGAKSPALLAKSDAVLSFVRQMDAQKKLVAPICRGSLLVAVSGIAKGRRLTGFHLEKEFPDLVIRSIVEANGGTFIDDQPVVVDGNLVSSRHPNDLEHFMGGIRNWIAQQRKKKSTSA